MQWGVFDTVDQVWMGDATGPKLFDEEAPGPDQKRLGPAAEVLAKVASQLVDTQLRQAPGRTRAKAYDGSGTTLKDEKPTVMTPLKALIRLERGAL
jgi:hypothetical protein